MINSASGYHRSGMTNKNVLSLDIRNKGFINYFPKGLQNIFGDLKAIVIENCHLKEIQQSDLKPFGELVLLGLSQNDIEIIEDGLFSFNPKLEDINFSSNRIIHIGTQAFENLNNLIYLILNSNNCIDEQAYDDAKEMARVIKLTKTACKDPTIACLKRNLQIIENRFDNSKCNCTQGSVQEFQTTDHKHCESNLTQSIEKLLNESKIEISSLKEHIKINENRSSVHDKLKMTIGVCIALNFFIFGILFIILYQVAFTS